MFRDMLELSVHSISYRLVRFFAYTKDTLQRHGKPVKSMETTQASSILSIADLCLLLLHSVLFILYCAWLGPVQGLVLSTSKVTLLSASFGLRLSRLLSIFLESVNKHRPNHFRQRNTTIPERKVSPHFELGRPTALHSLQHATPKTAQA